VSRRPGTLAAIAAVAAVVVAFVFSINLPGPIGSLTHPQKPHSPAAAPSAARSPGNSASPGVVAGSASPEPTATPPPPLSADCRAYYTGREPANWSAEQSLWRRLTAAAGSQDPRQVYSYCAQHVSDLPGAGDHGGGQPHDGGQGPWGGGRKDGQGGGGFSR
jgi:hypothetical protein